MRFWQKPDAIHGKTLQGTAQSFQPFSRDHDEAVLELDMKRLVTGICDELGVLEVPVREQVDLPGLFHPQAMGVGICAPRSQILCPRDCRCLALRSKFCFHNAFVSFCVGSFTRRP